MLNEIFETIKVSVVYTIAVSIIAVAYVIGINAEQINDKVAVIVDNVV
jgi:Ca2+/H+ antiporter